MNRFKAILLNIRRTDFAYISCFILIIGLVTSKFLLSGAMWLLIFAALFRLRDTGAKMPTPQYIGNIIQQFKIYPIFLIITLWFTTVFISGLWSEAIGFWLERVRLRLPFVILPIVFVSLPAFSKRQLYSLFYGFVILMSVISIRVLINYALHFEAINQQIKIGQSVLVPLDHIRFSVELSFATLCGLELWLRNFFWKKAFETQLILGLTLFLFVTLHLLSVRSGLACLYICLIIKILQYIFQNQKYIIGLGLLTILLSIPFAAYKTIPTLNHKINYALWDWKMQQQGTGQAYSDSERWISNQIGWAVWKTAPILGVGAGDVRRATEKIYIQKYPNLIPKEPHNQWLYIGVGTGILGLLTCLVAFFYPLLQGRRYQEPLFLMLHLNLFTSFIPESPVEIAIGAAFYAFFVCLYLNHLKI
jgi:O-antigen ligase